MISVHQVSLLFGANPLYENISFQVKKNDKIGLAGKNGAGKSTLLKLILGEQEPTSGSISKPNNLTIGYLPQELNNQSNLSIIEEVKFANKTLKKIEERLECINQEIVNRTDYESQSYYDLLDELSELNEQFSLLGGDECLEKAELVLKGLGFLKTDFSRPLQEFSGGWKMRVELAKLLVINPDVLLLDEPTNHLDIESIDWLERYMMKYAGAIVLISHDRQFLDRITNRTIEINMGKIYDYNCGYSKYLIRREQDIEVQMSAKKNQEKEIERKQKLIDKYRAKANKASFAQNLIKELDRMDKIEVDQVDTSKIKFNFPEPKHCGKIVFKLENIQKHYSNKTIFKGIDLTIGKGEKIALIGKNGIGKSTLIKVMMNQTDYQGQIQLGHQVEIGYFAQNATDDLDENKTVFEIIDEVAVGEVRKKIRELLGSFLFSSDDVEKKVKVLSGGEKMRLALCKLLLKPYNFLVLDEPTNHLDIVSKDVLKKALQNYTGTFLIVSHDRDFLSDLTDRVYYVKNQNISIYFDTVKQVLEDNAKMENVSKSDVKTNSPKKNKIPQNDDKQIKKIDRKIEELEAKKQENYTLLSKAYQEDSQDKITKLLDEQKRLDEELTHQMNQWEQQIEGQ